MNKSSSDWMTTWEVASLLGVTDKCIDARRRKGEYEVRKEMRSVECVSSLGKIFNINKPIWVYSPESVERLKETRKKK